MGSKYFIIFPKNHAPAIGPLGNEDTEATIALGYNVDIEYHDNEVDEKTLIFRAYAKLS